MSKQRITDDYLNEFSGYSFLFHTGGTGERIRQVLADHPIQTYTTLARQKPRLYKIPRGEADSVRRLDTIAEEINMHAADGSLTRELFDALHREATVLIRGEEMTKTIFAIHDSRRRYND